MSPSPFTVAPVLAGAMMKGLKMDFWKQLRAQGFTTNKSFVEYCGLNNSAIMSQWNKNGKVPAYAQKILDDHAKIGRLEAVIEALAATVNGLIVNKSEGEGK